MGSSRLAGQREEIDRTKCILLLGSLGEVGVGVGGSKLKTFDHEQISVLFL